MAQSAREHGRGRHSERWKGTFATTIDDIKHTDLTQAERDVLKADRERWERMGNSCTIGSITILALVSAVASR